MTLPQRLLRVVPVVTLALVACWGATLNNDDDCVNLGECLGLSFDDLFVLALVVPAAAVTFRMLHLDRVLLHTATLTVFGGMLWYAAGGLLQALDPSRSYDAPLPLPVVVGVAVLAAAASTVVVGPRGSARARIGICVAVVAASVGAGWAAGWAEQTERIEEISAAPVTLYAPVIAGESPQYGYASGDGVRLSYSVDVDGQHAFLSVELVPAPTGSLCAELVIYAEPGCAEEGDVMRNPGEILSEVALVRGDTALVAQYDADDLDDDDLLDALRAAPVVTAEELVG